MASSKVFDLTSLVEEAAGPEDNEDFDFLHCINQAEILVPMNALVQIEKDPLSYLYNLESNNEAEARVEDENPLSNGWFDIKFEPSKFVQFVREYIFHFRFFLEASAFVFISENSYFEVKRDQAVSLNLGYSFHGSVIVALVHTYPDFKKDPIRSKKQTEPFSLQTDSNDSVDYFVGKSAVYGHNTYYGLAKLTGQDKIHLKFNVESSYPNSKDTFKLNNVTP